MRESDEIMELARSVPGMVLFFSLAGNAILNGRSRIAYRMLVATGLGSERAWFLIEEWPQMLELESQIGWTPEVAAMGFVMNDVKGWRRVQWWTLVSQFAVRFNS